MTSNEIGKFGEDAACDYLERLGYEIIERNFRMKTGEIDIIARDGDCMVFAEVKTRRSNKFANASEYVDFRKTEHIRTTAMLYIGSSDTEVRFDVIEVYYGIAGGKATVTDINHLKAAF